MAKKPVDFENREFRMEGSYPNNDKINLKDATIVEGLSALTETTLEFFSNDSKIKHADFLGQTIIVSIKDQKEKEEYFSGYCISIDEIGEYQGKRLFTIEVRPWLWFLTLTRDNRVFQNKSTVQIIMEVLEKHGFTNRVKNSLTSSYEAREYCIQYRESDYDFICRLMEEDGIYFFFENDGKREQLILADGVRAHKPVPHDGATFEYHAVDGTYQRDKEHIYDWSDAERAATGKVTLQDYDFEKPKSDLKVASAIKSGNHPHANYEHYDYPGLYRETSEGNIHAKVRMESFKREHENSRGVCNIRGMRVGQTFKMTDHPIATNNNTEFLLTKAVHYVGIDTDYETDDVVNPLITRKKPKPEDLKNLGMAYRCTFDVMPKATQFRAPQKTPWPEIAGLHTALVVGPKAEEIYTDKYGRIKVQFHWDRKGQKDENSSCWVRVVMPWTGADWGMFGIPRIGQEVVIQFEEGDPDRPICTGMLYNKDTMQHYKLPDNKTQTGIVTRSTKKGKADQFHELVFEDKINEEEIRFQSERDYKQTIKNNAEITIGLEHKDKGDLTQTIQNHKTETLKEGDHTFKVEKGSQEIFVKSDHKETIEGKADQTITGNLTQTIKSGNHTTKIDSGNETVTVSKGNYTHKASAGKITIEAAQKISLKCGGSTIDMSPSGIKIKGTMVTVEGTGMVTVKGNMGKVQGSAMLEVKGGLVKIN